VIRRYWKILLALLIALAFAIAVPVLVFAEEVAPITAEALEAAPDALQGSPTLGENVDIAFKMVIALAFAWLGKFAVGRSWYLALLGGLETGVNQAWEEYVKVRKAGGRKLTEDEKGIARGVAITRAKAVMGIGAKILMATTPQARIAALISGIVNRRKLASAAAKS
jgi:energy-coupling factor transporter transmembrane protein EcfT